MHQKGYGEKLALRTGAISWMIKTTVVLNKLPLYCTLCGPLAPDKQGAKTDG